jgi:hypothetical protein
MVAPSALRATLIAHDCSLRPSYCNLRNQALYLPAEKKAISLAPIIRTKAEAQTTPAMSDNDKPLQPCTVDRPVRLTTISDDSFDACKKKTV